MLQSNDKCRMVIAKNYDAHPKKEMKCDSWRGGSIQDFMTLLTQVQTPPGAQEKVISFSKSKMCWLTVGVVNPSVCIHACIQMIMYTC